jgi:hypothetical protein
MAIRNCLCSPTSENPGGFSVSCLLALLSFMPSSHYRSSEALRNYSWPGPLCVT